MGKYMVVWEVEKTHIPLDPKERGEAYALLLAVAKQDIEKGLIKEWSMVVGESRGFNIAEGTEVEVSNMIQQYIPYINVQVLPLSTYNQAEEIVKALTG